MLGELREDNQALVACMVQIHDRCDETNDVATASLLENWIDQTQRRVWFLFETSQTLVRYPPLRLNSLDRETLVGIS